MDRQPERLAFDVPQCEIERAQRVRLFAAWRVEPRDVGFLPERLRPEWILADQRARALLERVLRPPLTNAGDADIRLDDRHHVALVEERIQVGRTINPDASDLGFGQLRRRRT